MSADPAHSSRRFSPTAAILAWLWPGLGHLSHGERRRGLLIMFGVLFLFVSGILIGGIDVVDRKRDGLWFMAQSFCGPIAFATDLANQRLLDRPPEWPSRRWDPDWVARYRAQDPQVMRELRSVSLGKVNEIGTLYVALAGLMNLVVMLDALHWAPHPQAKAA